MPDRATVEAARPKCPRGSDATATEPGKGVPCGQPLEWSPDPSPAGEDIWRCPEHGGVLTPEALVRRQTVADEVAA